MQWHSLLAFKFLYSTLPKRVFKICLFSSFLTESIDDENLMNTKLMDFMSRKGFANVKNEKNKTGPMLAQFTRYICMDDGWFVCEGATWKQVVKKYKHLFADRSTMTVFFSYEQV